MAQRNGNNGFDRANSEAAAIRWALGQPAKGRKPNAVWPLSAYLPPDLGERLGKMALATEDQMSDIIAFAVELYIDEHFGSNGEKLPPPQRERLQRKWSEITQAPVYKQATAKELEEIAKAQEELNKRTAKLLGKA